MRRVVVGASSVVMLLVLPLVLLDGAPTPVAAGRSDGASGALALRAAPDGDRARAAIRPLRSSRSAPRTTPGAPGWELVRFTSGISAVAPTTTTTAPPPPPTTTTTTAPPPPPTTTTTTAPPPPPTTTTTTAPPPPPTTTTTTAPPPPPAPQYSENGDATWYSAAPDGMCASPNLPFGTVLTVTNDATGASTTCTVDDREPDNPGRVVDLSYDGFAQIAPPSQGVVYVTISW